MKHRIKYYTMSLLSLIKVLFTITLICTSTISWAQGKISLNKAWISKTPINSSTYAGYLTITNSGDKNIELLSVSSSQFKKVEIRSTQIISNIARMIEQDGLEIMAKETIEFVPGGFHLMMIDPIATIKDTDKITLTFRFNTFSKKITVAIRKNSKK